jgi:hypothetical protein
MYRNLRYFATFAFCAPRPHTAALLISLLAGLQLAGCGNAAGSAEDDGANEQRDERPSRPRPDTGDDEERDTGNPDDDVQGDGDADADETPDTSDDSGSPVDTGVPVDTGATDTTAGPDTTEPGASGGFTGTVWAPGNAPGQVPSGQEIPVSGALVYLSLTPPAPIPQQAYCAACQSPPARAVLSDSRGQFTVQGYVPSRYWLVVEKGQFRREVQVDVVEGAPALLPVDQTQLPSRNAPSEGLTTPRIAMAVGASDHLEDILGKMNMGDIDSSGRYVPESGTGVLDIYSNGGSDGGVAVGSLGDLVRDPARLDDYHIIFIPCSGTSNTSVLNDQAVLRNLRNYVAAGGNLYVTDWSGEWADNVFPAQIELGSSGFGGIFDFGEEIDTPASAYNAATNTWNTSQFGTADGDSYDTPNAEVVEPFMQAWLNGQQGPTANSSSVSTYNALSFEVTGNWNFIEAVTAVEVGTDGGGVPIVDTPTVWVIGGQDLRPTPKRPLTVSYEPAGCGRVVFSTYHTTGGAHIGLVPQERVLLYLIMEIGTCRNPKI